MKRTLFLFIIFLKGFSSPVGNTLTPNLIDLPIYSLASDWIHLRVGYQGNFIVDARMSEERGQDSRIDEWQQMTNGATITLNLKKKVDVFASLASSKIDAHWRYLAPNDSIQYLKMKTHNAFQYGVGLRAIFLEHSNVTFGGGASYYAADYPAWGRKLDYRQWQVHLDFAYTVDFLTPYLGLKYSDARAKWQKLRFENRVPVGLFLGCAISSKKYGFINLEALLVDEEGCTLSGEIQF
jgi:hypothetical protein